MNFASSRFFRLKILIASNRCKYTPTKEFHISACGLKNEGFTERYKPCEKVNATGKSLSEAFILTSTNPQYENRLFIEFQAQHMKIPSSNLGRKRAYEKDLPVKNMIIFHK